MGRRSIVYCFPKCYRSYPASSFCVVSHVTERPTKTHHPLHHQTGRQEIDPDDVISVNTTEMLLPVTVRDRSGRLVSNLTRKDFRVFEDGVEQPLSDSACDKFPLTSH